MSPATLRGELLNYVLLDLVLVFVACGVWVVLARVVFRRLEMVPETIRRKLWFKVTDGVVLALALLAVAVVPVWLAGGYAPGQGWAAFNYPAPLPGNAGLMWGFFCFQALFEELLFRVVGLGLLAILFFWLTGVLFAPGTLRGRVVFTGRLWFWAGLAANLVTATGFAVAHADNANSNEFALCNIALAGLVLGQLYWNQGSPWGAWVVHWLWNAGLATLGLPVSGYAMLAPAPGFGFSGAREGMLTGGAFGPEGGVMATVALSLAWAWLVSQGWRAVKRREVKALRELEQAEQAGPAC